MRFEQWEENDFLNLDPDTKRIILRMTNLDPKRRATMDEILKDPWWKQDDGATSSALSSLQAPKHRLLSVLEGSSATRLVRK